jgi:hypothetical protein
MTHAELARRMGRGKNTARDHVQRLVKRRVFKRISCDILEWNMERVVELAARVEREDTALASTSDERMPESLRDAFAAGEARARREHAEKKGERLRVAPASQPGVEGWAYLGEWFDALANETDRTFGDIALHLWRAWLRVPGRAEPRGGFVDYKAKGHPASYIPRELENNRELEAAVMKTLVGPAQSTAPSSSSSSSSASSLEDLAGFAATVARGGLS